jgi:puromycin-sensitive aminopeptidase
MKKVKRLYGQFVPEHYDIRFEISEDKRSFNGSVVIAGARKSRPSKRITLHQKGLRITNTKITHTDKKGQLKVIPIKRAVTQKSYDELRLHTDETLFSGNYTLSMNFEGKITKNMDGVYPCFYEEDGKSKEFVATQFESHHAREAFPCIDEPEAKATFQLTLSHAKDEIPLSNTPVLSESINGSTKTTVFEKTPIMSTYLLAFVVGDIAYKEAISKNGVKIRTYSVPSQIENTTFALETAVRAMDFYDEYYDIPFPLPKCDFVALPDFASGAMENWGLITFREQTMLYNPAQTSLSTKQYVAIVVAHELTHQWFGNLVTMRWWTDLWLNEGFASWMEYLAIDKLFPEWHMWTQFASEDQQIALRADSLEHTHPVEVPVKHPDEIRTIFDTISYMKGASVIHMLHQYLGADGFRDGLRHYLKTYSYKNTDTIDLWRSLEEVTKKPVMEFMHAWTSKSGFPILDVSFANDHLHIEQRKFVSNPLSKERQSDKTLWPIPLLSAGLDKIVVTKKSTNVPVSTPPLKINVGQTGFYRVDYSHEMQQPQLSSILDKSFSVNDRMGLLADSFESTRAGYQPISEFLDLLDAYKNEDSLSVWEIIASSLGAIRSTLSKSDTDNTLRDLLKPFIRQLVKEELNRLGWEPIKSESHLDTLLRPLIIGLSAGADEPSTVKKVLDLYSEKIHGKNHIDPDLRTTVFVTAARLGGEKVFNELLKLYKKTDSADEKLSVTAAITSFEQPEIHKKVLALIPTEVVKLQDVGYWLAYSLGNRHGKRGAWKWMQENWDWLKANLGTDLSFARTPVYAARSFFTSDLREEYIKFFEPKMEPMLERAYNQGLEIMDTAVEWHKRDSDSTHEWLRIRS